MARRALLLTVVLASVVVETGCATPIKRDITDVSPEARIRVWHNDSSCCASPVIGTLVNYDGDSIRVRVPTQEQPIALSRASINWMESARRAGRGGRGALIGLGVGTVTGAIAVYRMCGCEGEWGGLAAFEGATAGSFFGSVVGLIVGLAIRRDIWDTVSR